MSQTTEVGVRAVKARLSEYLGRVRAGETITITDRGTAVARLVPVDVPAPPAWIDAAVRARRVQWSGGKPEGLRKRLPQRGQPASAMVLDDRR